jgi:hypothetical protein
MGVPPREMPTWWMRPPGRPKNGRSPARFPGWEEGAGLVLGLGGAGQLDAGGGVGGVGEARAVEPGVPGGGFSDLGTVSA